MEAPPIEPGARDVANETLLAASGSGMAGPWGWLAGLAAMDAVSSSVSAWAR
jgi:hypothetical protein